MIYLKESKAPEAFATFSVLPDIIKQAEWFRSGPNTGGKGRQVLHAVTPVQIGDERFAAHVVFKQALEKGNPFWKYYAIVFLKQKVCPELRVLGRAIVVTLLLAAHLLK